MVRDTSHKRRQRIRATERWRNRAGELRAGVNIPAFPCLPSVGDVEPLFSWDEMPVEIDCGRGTLLGEDTVLEAMRALHASIGEVAPEQEEHMTVDGGRPVTEEKGMGAEAFDNEEGGACHAPHASSAAHMADTSHRGGASRQADSATIESMDQLMDWAGKHAGADDAELCRMLKERMAKRHRPY